MKSISKNNFAYLLDIFARIGMSTDIYQNYFFRAEYGEKTVQKLNLRIDGIMNDLVVEKTKTQDVNDQLDETFELFSTH